MEISLENLYLDSGSKSVKYIYATDLCAYKLNRCKKAKLTFQKHLPRV